MARLGLGQAGGTSFSTTTRRTSTATAGTTDDTPRTTPVVSGAAADGTVGRTLSATPIPRTRTRGRHPVIQQTTIIGQFEDPADAQRAVDELASAGIAGDSVRLLPGAGSAAGGTGGEGGFLSSLGGMSLPDEDRHLYAEGMRRGYATVCVRVDEARAPAVEETLDRHGALDFDEREASWRSEGWQGHAAAEGGTTTTATLASAPGATAAGLGAARVRDDGVVERAEERLVVGKRQAAGGRVRVRSYVVETPFEEQVTLQQERVHVERRPVDRPVRPGDAVFQERVIEASERSEEAVVTKEARVVEEIGLRKEADTRTETVRDTVRRQEVEVEDDRTARGGTGVVTETAETTVTRDDGATGRDRR
jgi:stress response protein YsnF